MAYELNSPRYDFQIKYTTQNSDSSRTKTLGYVNFSSTGGASSALGLDSEGLHSIGSFICDSIMSCTNTGLLLQGRQDVVYEEGE